MGVGVPPVAAEELLLATTTTGRARQPGSRQVATTPQASVTLMNSCLTQSSPAYNPGTAVYSSGSLHCQTGYMEKALSKTGRNAGMGVLEFRYTVPF